MEGFCCGRLSKWRNRICMEKGTSASVVKIFDPSSLDFVYLDQEHDYNSVNEDLKNWWPKLTRGGIMALRNYNGNEGLKKAADEFKEGKKFEIDDYTNEIIFFR